MHLLRDCLILAGAGVGGGSLNYANTLYQPPEPFFQDKQWAHITDWRSELTPYYEQAQKMLGVVQNPHMTPADEIMKSVADDMGVGDTFIQTPVASTSVSRARRRRTRTSAASDPSAPVASSVASA